MHIDREDMLELTRRMTIARNCFNRVAGAYMDEEGFIDGSFNTHFLKLSPADKEKQLAIAKAIPYAKTNEQLKNYRIESKQKKPGSIWHLLTALRDCELKNDALLESFYDYIAENYHTNHDYAVYLFHNTYDIPLKAADHESLWESEEIYEYIICAICPVSGDYEPGKPECGFIFPAFNSRTEDPDYIDIYQSNPDFPQKDLLKILQIPE